MHHTLSQGGHFGCRVANRPRQTGRKGGSQELASALSVRLQRVAGGVVLDDGLFPYHADFDEEWGRLCPRTFLLRAFDVEPRSGDQDWHLAGFAMVSEDSPFGQNIAPPQWCMEDFFVLRKYRRAGAGRYLAMHCFERFRGRWEVAEYQSNAVAQAFWRNIIAEHTNGRFEEVIREDGPGWAVQLFDNTTVDRGGTTP